MNRLLFNIELATIIFYYIISCRLERIFKNFETLHLQVRIITVLDGKYGI
jgi:hypothetical protein